MTLRLILSLALAVLPVVAAPASAQEERLSFVQKLAVYRACKPDLDQLCPEVGTAAGRIRACLVSHQVRLSQGCLAAARQAIGR